MGSYDDVYRRSIEDPEGFWGEAAADIDWETPPETVLDSSRAPFYRWFAGGRLNTCFNALDRHVDAGRGDQPALIYDSPVTSTVTRFTYRELRDEVARFAGVLRGLGVEKGDTVIVYLPMVPEAAIAMLACARLGAVHSVVFGGFAANELAVRIDHAQPKVVVSVSCGIEVARVIEYKPLLDAAIEQATHRPDHCVILQRPMVNAQLVEPRDVDWAEAMAGAQPVDCVTVEATDPLYILYTSGTTGRPKGVVRDNGGHAVALCWSIPNVYGVGPGEVYWAASDVGWVVGHSYIVYAPLLAGCTTILYEGKPVGTPDPGAFWRVVADHGVNALFTAPTAFRAIKKEDPKGEHLSRYDLSSLRHLFLAGERTDPDTYHWARDLLGIPVIDHWWQTETGWAVAANCVGIEELPVKPGSPTKAVPGYDVRVLDELGEPAPAGQEGAIVIRLPLPPGCLPTLYKDDPRYVNSYLTRYDGYYLTGDGGHIDEDGYVFVMGRTDDVINVAGHRLSTGAMEEVIATHPDVAECAVIGVADELKGQMPVGLVVLKAGVDRDTAEVEAELVRLIRDQIGPVAAFKTATVVPRLPKTRSGKILRATMRDIADGREYRVPSTIDDPAILDEIGDALGERHARCVTTADFVTEPDADEPPATPPESQDSEGSEKRKLPRPVLAVVSVLMVGFVVAGYVGDALAPTLVDTRPLLLLVLNPRVRNLVLITNQLDAATFYVAGAVRLMLSDPLFYVVGYFYGDAAIRWTERRAPTYGDLFRRLERFFGRASYPMVAIAPNSYICLFAGAARMPLGAFFSLNLIGTVVRLYLIRKFGEAFNDPIDWVLDFIGRYRVPLLVLSVVLVAFSIWSEKRQGETQVESLGNLEEELGDAEHEVESERKDDTP